MNPHPYRLAKVRVKGFERTAGYLAPLAGRGRKPRIARLSGEGRFPAQLQAPCSRQGPLTPALSPQAGRGSISRLWPVYEVSDLIIWSSAGRCGG